MSLDESLDRDIIEHCPMLDERLETLKRANTSQNRYYVECDLKILSVINKRLYNKYHAIYIELTTIK